jgi:hypothetical protein
LTRKLASETSKNTLPTASTFSLASANAALGSVTSCEPSFGVPAARTCGYVRPPSAERLIFTLAVDTGGAAVCATSQVTVADPPPTTGAPSAWDVTRNGPAAGASVRTVSSLPMPAPPDRLSRAVTRKFSSFGLTPATPV